MRLKTTLYLTILTIHIAAMVNKPQDIECLSVKSISTKYIKNWFQDTISGVITKIALTNKNQLQKLPRKYLIYK